MLRSVIYGKGCYGFSQLMLPPVPAASACFFLYRRLYSYQGIPLPVVRHLARHLVRRPYRAGRGWAGGPPGRPPPSQQYSVRPRLQSCISLMSNYY